MNQVDPKATKFASKSPYHFAGNNPVYFNDPLGDDYYVPTWLYNMAMGMLNQGSPYQAGPANTPIQDPGGGYGGGGGSGYDWGNAYDGSATWTPSTGWSYITNSQAIEAGMNYNNNFGTWHNTALNNTSDEYGASQYVYNGASGNVGGFYFTENGLITGFTFQGVIQQSSGAYLSTSAIDISIFTQAVNNTGFMAALKNFDLPPIVTKSPDGNSPGFWDGVWGADNKTNFAASSSAVSYSAFIVDGIGTSIDKSARTVVQINNAKRVGSAFKVVGVVGNVIVAGLNFYEGSEDGDVSAGDWFKVGASLAQAALVLSPVGWGVLAYNGLDLIVGIATGTSITDRVANGIDNLMKQ